MHPDVSKLLQNELDLGKNSSLLKSMIIGLNRPTTEGCIVKQSENVIRPLVFFLYENYIEKSVYDNFSIYNLQIQHILGEVFFTKQNCKSKTKVKHILLLIVDKLNKNKFNNLR